jgi:DNA-binding transcriptional LysR family regulator
MNLRQLEILRAVICHRTTVAAADELALSQPAVSNALKTMEAQAERVNNRLFPTAEAMALHKESEAIFALHAKSRARFAREPLRASVDRGDAAARLQHHSIRFVGLSAPTSGDTGVLRCAAL